MSRITLTSGLILAAVLSLIARQGRADDFQTAWCKTTSAGESRSPTPVAASYSRFALRLYKKLVAASPRQNTIASPASIHLAVSMANAGALKETQAGLIKALSLPKSFKQADDWYARQASLLAQLSCPTSYQTYTLRMANAMFAQTGKAFEPPFAKRLAKAFDAKPMTVDFAKDKEKARHTINEWVEKQTDAKIKDLIAPGQVDATTKVALVNALYLRAGWNKPFEPEKTRSRAFHLDAKSSVKVPMMEREGAAYDYEYARVGNADVVRLGLGGGGLTMTIVVPTEVEGLAMVEKALSKDLSAVDKGLEARKVNLTLPKFSVTDSFELATVLKKMGAKRAFDRKKADFSGIDGGKDKLFISNVVHKTFVDVHEAGFEAAAATATLMAAGSAAPPPQEPVNVVVDRPFMFFVSTSSEKIPLIIGRIVDPRAGT